MKLRHRRASVPRGSAERPVRADRRGPSATAQRPRAERAPGLVPEALGGEPWTSASAWVSPVSEVRRRSRSIFSRASGVQPRSSWRLAMARWTLRVARRDREQLEADVERGIEAAGVAMDGDGGEHPVAAHRAMSPASSSVGRLGEEHLGIRRRPDDRRRRRRRQVDRRPRGRGVCLASWAESPVGVAGTTAGVVVSTSFGCVSGSSVEGSGSLEVPRRGASGAGISGAAAADALNLRRSSTRAGVGFERHGPARGLEPPRAPGRRRPARTRAARSRPPRRTAGHARRAPSPGRAGSPRRPARAGARGRRPRRPPASGRADGGPCPGSRAGAARSGTSRAAIS